MMIKVIMEFGSVTLNVGGTWVLVLIYFYRM